MIASIFTDFAVVLARYLFEAGHELGREYGIGELSQELFEHARHDGGLVVAEVDARPPRAERVAKLGLLRFDTRGAVDALLHEPCKGHPFVIRSVLIHDYRVNTMFFDVVDAESDNYGDGNAVVALVPLAGFLQRDTENGTFLDN